MAGSSGQCTDHPFSLRQGCSQTDRECAECTQQLARRASAAFQALSQLLTCSAGVQERHKRPFVQSFFLAVQERGYYVLNDVFRCAWLYLGPAFVVTQEQLKALPLIKACLCGAVRALPHPLLMAMASKA